MNGNGLFGSTTLDVVIGLIFVYLLLAIICTNLNEWIAGIFNTRATTLRAAIGQLLESQAGHANSQDTNWFLQQFYNHPLISVLRKPGDADSHPAYIAPRAFATAVMDIVTPQKPGVINFQDLETGINNLPDGDVKTSLLAVTQTCNNNILQAQKNIEAWYDDTMQRVSGWYRKRTQLWTVIIATALTLCANANTIRITRTLWQSPTVRAQLVSQAANQSSASQNGDLSRLGDVVGWTNEGSIKTWTVSTWGDHALGWFLSIVAISLGAPFWFDLLNKFMRVRNGGDAPEETPAPNPKPPPSPESQKAATA
jgi:hypothetical protein